MCKTTYKTKCKICKCERGHYIVKKSMDVQDLYTIHHGYFKREILAKSYCAIQMHKTCESITECITSYFKN